MNLGKQIKALVLLAVMLTVSFPVQEFFHDHDFLSSNHCTVEHHHLDSKKSEKCHHKAHVSKKETAEFCFLLHISKNFVKQPSFYFLKLSLVKIPYLKQFYNFYKTFHFSTYLLRGPPSTK